MARKKNTTYVLRQNGSKHMRSKFAGIEKWRKALLKTSTCTLHMRNTGEMCTFWPQKDNMWKTFNYSHILKICTMHIPPKEINPGANWPWLSWYARIMFWGVRNNGGCDKVWRIEKKTERFSTHLLDTAHTCWEFYRRLFSVSTQNNLEGLTFEGDFCVCWRQK